MPVTTRARKRALREAGSSEAAYPFKHTKGIEQKEPKTFKRDSKAREVTRTGAAGSQYKSLIGAEFPHEILALPHVLSRINLLAMKPEDAVLTAIRLNRIKWLHKLLKRDDCDSATSMEYAAANGHVEAVQTLLPEVMGEGEYTLDDSIESDLMAGAVAAASGGHLAIVELLLGEIVAEREDENEGQFVYYGYERDIEDNKINLAWEVLDVAAASGHLDIVEFVSGFATEEEHFPASERSTEALSSAIAGGHIDVVAHLLEQYSWDVLDAFASAVENEQPEITDMIYDDYCHKINKGDMFERLASRGSTNALEYLYRRGHYDSDLIGRAFVQAVHHIDTLEFLLTTGCVSTASFDKAFEIAAAYGSVKVVENLYNKGYVSIEVLNKAFEKGTSIDVIKFLYRTQKIRSKSVIAAFCPASQRGNTYGYGYRTEQNANANIVKFLRKHPSISSEIIDKAFLFAADKNDHVTVKLLLSDERLSSDTIIKAFDSAVEKGCQNVVKILRRNEEISSAFCQKAFARVVTSGHGLHLVQQLYDEQHTPDALVREAFLKVASRGLIRVVELLFDKSAISTSTKHEAFVRAAQNDERDVVEFMESQERFPLDVLNKALKAARKQQLKLFLRGRITTASSK